MSSSQLFEHPEIHYVVEAGTTAGSNANAVETNVILEDCNFVVNVTAAAAVDNHTEAPCQHYCIDSEGDTGMQSIQVDEEFAAASSDDGDVVLDDNALRAIDDPAELKRIGEKVDTASDDDDTVMDEAALQAQIELIELKRSGEKVVLPEPKRRKAHASALAAIVVTTEAAFDWAPYSNEQLEDWLDLEELGCAAPWPDGANRKLALAEMRARREALRRLKMCMSTDAPT
jgi:hypothetical protein